MQIGSSDGIPRTEYLIHLNHFWADQEIVEVALELQRLLCRGRPRWELTIGQEGPLLVQRDQAWLVRCEPVVPRPAKFHWSTQCPVTPVERKERQPRKTRGHRVSGGWVGVWYGKALLVGVGASAGFAAGGILVFVSTFILLRATAEWLLEFGLTAGWAS